jgi:hypothetical protein
VAGGKDASNQRRAQRLQERWEHIADIFVSEWKRHVENALNQVKNETVRQYQTLHDAIEAVFARIEQHAGGSVLGAEQRIQIALEKMAVPPVFQSQMLLALSGMQSGRAAHAAIRPATTKHVPVKSPPRNVVTPPFVSSAPSKTKELGRRVVHHRLGQGVVVDIVGTTYTIQFDGERATRKFGKNVLSDPEWFVQV